MKKLWLALPLFLAAPALFAQAVAAPANAAPSTALAAEAVATNASVFVDTVDYTYTKDGVLYASPRARFQVQGVDTQSGLDKIFVSVDKGEFALYKGPISFAEEGQHSLVYQFIDKVSNVSYSQVFNILIDAAAPRVLEPVFQPALYVASGYNYVGPQNNISFKYHDDGVGVAFIEYAANSHPMARYSNAFTPAALGFTQNGPVALNYQATDMVSNVTAAKTFPIFVDAKAPTVNVFAKVFELDGIRYISPKDVVQIEAFDAETKVKEILYAINDGAFTNYDAAIGIRLAKAGEYDIKAKAVDVVGNMSEEVIYSVVVDALAPTGETSYAGASPAAVAPVEEVVAPVQNAADPAQQPAAPAAVSEEVPAGTTAPAAQ